MHSLEKPLDHLLSDGGFCAIFRSIGCIGDSLASGEHESLTGGRKGYHDYYEYSWGQYMARACGATAQNFSVGGLTALGFLEKMARKDPRFALYQPEKKCQAYIVALGCNDITAVLQGKLEMGDISDVHPQAHSENAPSFAGYMGAILSHIKAVEPKARIFLLTMPQRPDADPQRVPLQERHAQLMYQLAELFEYTYVIDLRQYAPAHDADFREVYYLGGHLNAMGYLLTAKQLMSYIDYIIRTHPEDFAQTAFIGRGGDLHNESQKW